MKILFNIFFILSLGFAQDWNQIGSNIDGEADGDRSGRSVAISADGSRVAIGAIRNDDGGSNAGHVRVYSESGGLWTQVGSDIDGEAAGDNFGRAVALSSDGTRVAIGAPKNDGIGSNAGHVRVYSESGGVWMQVGSDIDGEAADDNSGISIDLSADGTRIAIGANKNAGNGIDAGHVRIYSESGGIWTQVGGDIDGEAAGDESGFAVALSSDGTIVAVGALHNSGIGLDAGHVRIYTESGGVCSKLAVILTAKQPEISLEDQSRYLLMVRVLQLEANSMMVTVLSQDM